MRTGLLWTGVAFAFGGPLVLIMTGAMAPEALTTPFVSACAGAVVLGVILAALAFLPKRRRQNDRG